MSTPEARGGWALALEFSGDVQGAMHQVTAGDPATASECSGRNSRQAGGWASALYGPVGRDVYEVVVTVHPYRGPGTYHEPAVSVQVSTPDGSAVWRSGAGDGATFTIAAGEEAGSLDATLTNLGRDPTRLYVGGSWSCRT